ncbi:MAG: hypothetical protein QXR53_01355 [Candidatus Norongarragalinales archaeon]
MKRRNFERDFFNDDFFEEFEKIEEMMRDMLDAHFRDLNENDLRNLEGTRPKVYGFTLEFGPEGKGKLKEIGITPALRKQPEPKSEPFVEILNHPEEIRVVAELPGVEEKHLHLKVFPKQLSIRVSDPQRFLAKVVSLPAEVVEKSFKSTLKNGILEIVLKKKK